MRYTGYKYNRYRGRRPNYTLPIVLVSLALLLGIFWFFLSDYMIFSADGFRFGSSLEEPEVEKPPVEFEDPNFIIEDNRPKEPDPVEPDPAEPDLPEIPVLSKLYPADVTRAAEDGYLAGCIAAAKAGGYDAVALTVRSEDGLLYIPCTSRYREDSVQENAEALASAVRSAAAEFPFAAVLPVCRDGKAPRLFRDQAVMTSGVTWLDYNYVSWFDPYQPGAGDYAAALMESCRDAGFSAVVLTRLSFPGRGKLDLIDCWDGQSLTKQQVITALAARLAEKAGELGLQTALLLESDQPENVLVTGQSVADLQQHFTCIYIPQGDPQALAQEYPEGRFGIYSSEDGYIPHHPAP